MAKEKLPTKAQFERLLGLIEKQTETDPVSLLDGTKKKYFETMQKWFTERNADGLGKAALTKLVDEWYTVTRKPWDGWVDFDAVEVSALSTGTKGGDNASLTCTPSTNETAGQDDYAGLPLFACVDCNWEIDPDTLEPVITAIAGITKGFERYNPEKMVGVLQASGYVYMHETATNIRLGYTATFIPYATIQPLPEAVRPSDRSVRPWVLHAKYPNKTVDGKLTSYSGPIPTAFNISHNTLHTLAAATGTGYSGMCFCDWSFLRLMFHIKYASLSADGILQGCLANNVTAAAAVSEVGVKRLLLTTNPGFEAGMGVLVGVKSASDAIDRSANNYSISTNAGCKITAIETVNIAEDEYVAVYVDVEEPFDTTADTTCIATFHWPNGSSDNVLGNDGSPKNPGGGKYPAKLQGIEYSVGGSEVLADTIIDYFQQDDIYKVQAYTVNRVANQATSITGNYKASEVVVEQSESAGYRYIKKMALAGGMLFPEVFGGSSSTYFKDSWYMNGSITGVKELFVFGSLNSGTASYGLSYGGAYGGLTGAYWAIVSRPSPNGNRGEWTA